MNQLWLLVSSWVVFLTAARLTSAGPVRLPVLVLLAHHQGNVVGQDGHGVDDVERPAQEVQLAAGLDEAQDELQGEPGHTHRLDDEHVVAFGGTFALRIQRRKRSGARDDSEEDGWRGHSKTKVLRSDNHPLINHELLKLCCCRETSHPHNPSLM